MTKSKKMKFKTQIMMMKRSDYDDEDYDDEDYDDDETKKTLDVPI